MMKHSVAPYRFPLGGIDAGVLAAAGVICVLALDACRGDSVSANAWDGAVRDSAGIRIVENFGTPLWTEGERWDFTEVLRIGAVVGEPEYQFGRITGLAVLSDRRVVVADAMSHNLRFFSADGIHERTVGREGKGPGEFGDRGLELHQGPGDTLLVHDIANARVNAIAPDGTWLGSFSTQVGDNYSDWDDDVATGRLVSKHTAVEQPDTLSDALDIVLKRDVRGAVLDTVALVPTTRGFAREGDLRFYYHGRPDFDLCGDGLLTGRSDEYRILRYGSDGTVDRIFSLAWEPLPMTDEDQSIIRQRWNEELQRYPNTAPERVAALKSSLRFESTYPAYRRFTCGPGATVLVQHMRPVRDLLPEEREKLPIGARWLPGAAEWDVFDPEGRYLGVAVLPGTDWVAGWRDPRFVRAASGTWYIYSVWSDEQDVEYVRAWRLDGNVPG
jgi:hypothetical protein